MLSIAKSHKMVIDLAPEKETLQEKQLLLKSAQANKLSISLFQ